MKSITTTFILLLLFSSCDAPEVWFENAQPEGKKELMHFPRKLQGKYVNCSNPNDFLLIEKTEIRNVGHFVFTNHIDSVLSTTEKQIDRNDTNELKEHFKSENIEINIKGDSLQGTFKYENNLFNISEKQIVKKFKRSYFLNTEEGENKWKVQRMDSKGDSLFIGEINPSDTLLNYDFVAQLESDEKVNSKYLIQADKRELKKLMKENAFEEVSCYCKVKN